MKRPKSKRFKLHKDLIKTAVGNIDARITAELQATADRHEFERIADEKFIQENRLEIEMHRRANSA